MKKMRYFPIIILTFLFCLAPNTDAEEMSSDNFRIPTSVVSGGGTPMNSNNFKINATMGQPSPLMDPLDPPYSADYDLYPGFWYTGVTEDIELCEGDFDGDDDVDGSDLAVFAADFGRTDCSGDCEGDFDTDGDVDGSDLATFAADFGRTDCP